METIEKIKQLNDDIRQLEQALLQMVNLHAGLYSGDELTAGASAVRRAKELLKTYGHEVFADSKFS